MINIPIKKLTEKSYIPVLGLGTASLSGTELKKTLWNAFDLGYRHIDTADYYMNHEDIGEAIDKAEIKRDEFFIATKVWKTDLAPSDVKNVLKKSLEELKTTYIDLYLIHAPSDVVPISDTLSAMKELQEEGLVNAVGVSNFNKVQMEIVLDTQSHWSTDYKVVNNQIEYHIKEKPDELVQYCFDNNVSVTAYSPFGAGSYIDSKTLRILSYKYNKSKTQIILKWIIQKGMIVIPRSSSYDHLKENIDLFDWELESDDINMLSNDY